MPVAYYCISVENMKIIYFLLSRSVEIRLGDHQLNRVDDNPLQNITMSVEQGSREIQKEVT